MEEEIWKDVVGYEGIYQVSSIGRFRSLARTFIRHNTIILGLVCDKILKTGKLNSGYENLSLRKEGENRKTFIAHRLVALAFIPNPENKSDVNHKNGIRNDNRVENLEWCTVSDNHKHAYRVLGRIAPGKNKFGSKSHRARPICAINPATNKIEHIFECAKDAAGFFNKRSLYMYRYSLAKGHTRSGYAWKYITKQDYDYMKTVSRETPSKILAPENAHA